MSSSSSFFVSLAFFVCILTVVVVQQTKMSLKETTNRREDLMISLLAQDESVTSSLSTFCHLSPVSGVSSTTCSQDMTTASHSCSSLQVTTHRQEDNMTSLVTQGSSSRHEDHGYLDEEPCESSSSLTAVMTTTLFSTSSTKTSLLCSPSSYPSVMRKRCVSSSSCSDTTKRNDEEKESSFSASKGACLESCKMPIISTASRCSSLAYSLKSEKKKKKMTTMSSSTREDQDQDQDQEEKEEDKRTRDDDEVDDTSSRSSSRPQSSCPQTVTSCSSFRKKRSTTSSSSCFQSVLHSFPRFLLIYSTCILFFVTMILMSNPSSCQSNCPAKCTCIWKNGKQTTNCESQGLISIPAGIQASTQVLNLNSNKLHILPSKVFQERGLINLQKVFLSKCQLATIHRDALIQLTNLVELDISFNVLTSIPSDPFEATPALRRLVLNNNPIGSIRANSFSLTPNLNALDLSGCQIDSIEAGAFKGLSSLQFLKLEGNRLATLSFLVLQDLPPLYSLDLHSNPWNCDCLLRPAREWMIRNNVPQSVPPTCSGPDKLTGNMWNSLALDDFACPPSILSRDTDITAMIGNNASFTCITRAQPEAKISWLIEDVIYRNLSSPGQPPGTSMSSSQSSQTQISDRKNDRLSFTEDRSSGPGLVSATLTIINLESGDNGKSYVCYAENSAGIASKAFTVSVLNLSGSVVGGWTKVETASGIIGLVAALLVIIIAIVIFIVRSKKFKDNGSSRGSTSKPGHHPIHSTDNGSSGSSSSSTNSHKSTASTTGSFPTIDVLKNVPVSHSTPSPLGSKEILENNGQIVGYNNFVPGLHQHHLHNHGHNHHHHALHPTHFNHLHHVHPYSSHDPTEIMMNDSGMMLQQQQPHFVSSGHVTTYGGEFMDQNGYPANQYHQQQQSSYYPGDQTPSQQMVFDEQQHHQQALYAQHSAVISSSNNSLNQHHNSSSTNINNMSLSNNSDEVITGLNNQQNTLSTLNPETIPVSGTCVICEQPFSDLRFHYMDFHEIRECIV